MLLVLQRIGLALLLFKIPFNGPLTHCSLFMEKLLQQNIFADIHQAMVSMEHLANTVRQRHDGSCGVVGWTDWSRYLAECFIGRTQQAPRYRFLLVRETLPGRSFLYSQNLTPNKHCRQDNCDKDEICFCWFSICKEDLEKDAGCIIAIQYEQLHDRRFAVPCDADRHQVLLEDHQLFSLSKT